MPGKIGHTTVAVTQDLHSEMSLVLKKKNSSAFGTVQTHTSDCMQEDQAYTIRTVSIPWLVASYDTYKGKRRLNSNPQATEAKMLFYNYSDL